MAVCALRAGEHPPRRAARAGSTPGAPLIARTHLPCVASCASQNRVFNRPARFLLAQGLAPPTYALLETTGRRSGLPRQVPVANGLQGSTIWLIAGLGEHAQYVLNIRANPRVRIKARPGRLRDGVRMRWYEGTAEPLPGDDARERHRQLGRGRPGYRLDGVVLRRLASLGPGPMLTIRIDLDPHPG